MLYGNIDRNQAEAYLGLGSSFKLPNKSVKKGPKMHKRPKINVTPRNPKPSSPEIFWLRPRDQGGLHGWSRGVMIPEMHVCNNATGK